MKGVFEENVTIAKARIGFAVVLLVMMLGIGTVIFHNIETYPEGHEFEGEQWSFVDSFYFSGITLTTIGYGDMHPSNDVSKIVTVLYAIIGVALVLYALGVIARWYVDRSMQLEQHEVRIIKRLLRGKGLHESPSEKQTRELRKEIRENI